MIKYNKKISVKGRVMIKETNEEIENTLMNLKELSGNDIYHGYVSHDVLERIVVTGNFPILQHLPKTFFEKDKVDFLLKKYPESMEYFPVDIRNNKQFMLNFFIKNSDKPDYFRFLTGQLRYDLTFLKSIMKNLDESNQCKWLMSQEIEHFFQDRTTALDFIKKNPYFINELSKYIKDDQWNAVGKYIVDGTHSLYYCMIDFEKVTDMRVCIAAVQEEISTFNQLTKEQKSNIKILQSVLFDLEINDYPKFEKEAKEILENGFKEKSYNYRKIMRKLNGDIPQAIWDSFIYDKSFMKLCTKSNVDPTEFIRTEDNPNIFIDAIHHMELSIKLKNVEKNEQQETVKKKI